MLHLRLGRAASILILCSTQVGEASADDEGCTVFLCLSNPAGWAAVSQCVPPVERALKNMAKGRVPRCEFSGGAGGSDARIAWIEVPGPLDADGKRTVQTVRVLEYRDAAGATRRLEF